MSSQAARSPAGRRRRGGGGREMVPPAQPRSYYGLPVIAEPVWKAEVPWYFVVGGMAGAAAPLAAGARATGNVALAQRASAVALAGSLISPVLLIADLGRPERFHHMLRVVKPTSPMNVGSWVLSGFGVTSALAAGWQLLGIVPKAVGAPAAAAAGVLGPVLATYTAVLISTTAIPAWHDARHELPFVFAGSSLAAAGGACLALTPVEHAAPARAMAVGGALLELAADSVMEHRLEPVVRGSYERSPVRSLHLGARVCAIAGGLLAALLGGRSRSAAAAGGSLLVAGSALQRLAIFKAGVASAQDPVQTIEPQRKNHAKKLTNGCSE
ncbi:MAG TPA: NrfD/PsrC family molybdoenzyme membrane anchor subunit [Solirubrobacteraceae bacterium]|nr:NrfD/PsrC family molybdoenzyme membrane anchor subunit [Solirubrobacteraceae bacterium]